MDSSLGPAALGRWQMREAGISRCSQMKKQNNRNKRLKIFADGPCMGNSDADFKPCSVDNQAVRYFLFLEC